MGNEVLARLSSMSERVFEDTTWENEESLSSSQGVLILGFLRNQEAGRLNSTFTIRRRIKRPEYLFEEVGRTIRLHDLLVPQWARRYGVGSAMLRVLDQYAVRFGASEIEGSITSDDLAEQIWLPDFYQRRGFQLFKRGAGYKIIKALE